MFKEYIPECELKVFFPRSLLWCVQKLSTTTIQLTIDADKKNKKFCILLDNDVQKFGLDAKMFLKPNSNHSFHISAKYKTKKKLSTYVLETCAPDENYIRQGICTIWSGFCLYGKLLLKLLKESLARTVKTVLNRCSCDTALVIPLSSFDLLAAVFHFLSDNLDLEPSFFLARKIIGYISHHLTLLFNI